LVNKITSELYKIDPKASKYFLREARKKLNQTIVNAEESMKQLGRL